MSLSIEPARQATRSALALRLASQSRWSSGWALGSNRKAVGIRAALVGREQQGNDSNAERAAQKRHGASTSRGRR